jgi:hypothetical protein
MRKGNEKVFGRHGNQKLPRTISHTASTPASCFVPTQLYLFMNNGDTVTPLKSRPARVYTSRFEGYMCDGCHEVENASHHTPARGWRHCIVSMGMARFSPRLILGSVSCSLSSLSQTLNLARSARMAVLRDASCRPRITSCSQSITCGPTMVPSIYWMCVPLLHDRPVFEKFPRMSSLASLASPRTGLPVQFRSLLPCLIFRLCWNRFPPACSTVAW